MTDIVGPTNAPNTVTSRPSDTRGSLGSLDTWFKDCTSVAAGDGTFQTAALFNQFLALFRGTIRGNGNLIGGSPVIAEDNGDDMLLRSVLQMIQRGQAVYAEDSSGTPNAIVANPTPAVLEYKKGLRLQVKLNNNITGASVANISGLGNKSVVLPGGGATANLDYLSGDILDLEFNGTALVCATPINQAIIDTSITQTVGAGQTFAGYASAMAWLSRRRIAATGAVKWSQVAGNGGSALTVATRITLAHPDLGRLTIAGQTCINGGFPAHSNFQVSGSGSGARATDLAANLAMCRNRVPSELHFTAGAGLYIVGGISAINDLLITGDGTTTSDGGYGLAMPSGGGSLLGRVAIAGHAVHGAYLTGGITSLGDTCVSFGNGSGGWSCEAGGQLFMSGPGSAFGNAGHGFSTLDTSSIKGTVASYSQGNGGDGYLGQSTSAISLASGSVGSGNGVNGAHGNGTSSIFANGCTFSSNGAAGCLTYGSSFASVTASTLSSNGTYGINTSGSTCIATGATLAGNVTKDVYVENGGFNNVQAATYGTISPALNTVGNANALNGG